MQILLMGYTKDRTQTEEIPVDNFVALTWFSFFESNDIFLRPKSTLVLLTGFVIGQKLVTINY